MPHVLSVKRLHIELKQVAVNPNQGRTIGFDMEVGTLVDDAGFEQLI